MNILINFILIISLYIYMYQIITLYTLNLHKIESQLYLNKAEGKWYNEKSAYTQKVNWKE